MKDLGSFYRHKNVQAITMAFKIEIFIFFKSVLLWEFNAVCLFLLGAADEATTTGESKKTINGTCQNH